MTDQNRTNDLFMLQVRLFRLAQQVWNMSAAECSELFEKYDIYNYISICYEEFHVQGDDANLSDIKRYIDVRRTKDDTAK